MGVRIPHADYTFKTSSYGFKKGRQANLISQAQNIHNKLVGNTSFPTISLPITLAAFQTLIDTYQTSLALGGKNGSKNATANKNTSKNQLLDACRLLGIYVTNTAYNVQGGILSTAANYDLIAATILSSGFQVSFSTSPVANTSGIPLPIVKSVISKTPGTISFLIRQYQGTKNGVKMWVINLRTSEVGVTPAGVWKQYYLPSSNNKEITALISGLKYDYQIAGQGGINTKTGYMNPLNFTPISTVVVT